MCLCVCACVYKYFVTFSCFSSQQERFCFSPRPLLRIFCRYLRIFNCIFLSLYFLEFTSVEGPVPLHTKIMAEMRWRGKLEEGVAGWVDDVGGWGGWRVAEEERRGRLEACMKGRRRERRGRERKGRRGRREGKREREEKWDEEGEMLEGERKDRGA